MHLSWTAAGDASITQWQYRQKAGADNYGSWTDIAGSGAATTSHAVTGLKNAVAYKYRIRALNSSGIGAESGEATATPAPVPAKPTGLTASARDRGVHLSWTDPRNATIARWQYRQKAGPDSYGSWTDIAGSGAATTSHAVTGLKNAVAYKYRIRALNSSGAGAESNEATATPAPAPSKPTGLTASARDKAVHLSWTAAGDATITQWQYRQKAGADNYGSWTDIAGSGAATTSHAVTGLKNAVAYKYRIRALNSSGIGAESGEAMATPAPVPSKPAGLTAAAQDKAVLLSWTAAGDATITQWQYRQKAGTGNYGNWTEIAGSGSGTTSHTVTGLENGTAHAFKVRALNSSGAGAASDEATATPMAPPAKPTGLTASARDKGVHLSWSDPSDASITQYQYRQKVGAGGYGNWTGMAGSGSKTIGHAVTGLENGTAYAFKIRALNPAGAGAASDAATATPISPPAKPAGLTVSARDRGAHLSWTAAGDASITGYQYWQKEEGAKLWGWEDIAGSGSATTSHTVTGLKNGTAYEFRIRALNPVGKGVSSDAVTATPVTAPAKPAGLAASARDRGVHLSWTNPGNATITQWQYRQKAGTDNYGSWTDMAGSVAATTSHAVTGLKNAVAYKFRIRALNSSGTGAASDEATATPAPVPAKPAGLTTAARDRGVHLSWTAAGNATITQWQYRQKAGADNYGSWTDMAGSVAATTSHAVTGLKNAVAYKFRIRALNSSGTGAESDEATATPAPVPAKPAGLAASAQDKAVLLSWTAAGDATITQWQYRQKVGAGGYGNWTDIAGSVAATTSHTVTGLANNTAHAFKVRALNLSGAGAESDEATATPTAPPAKPTGLTASARDRGVHLSWSDPGDASITKYQYWQKEAAGNSSRWADMAGSGAATTSHTVTWLKNGATYEFRIRAMNPAGKGARSDKVSAMPVTAPWKPANLTAAARDKGVRLEWTDPSNATITQWQYRQKAGADSYGSWTAIANSSAATTSHTVTGLKNGVAYKYRIRALNSSGAGAESDEATVMPAAVPLKPAGLTASARDKGAHLSWTAAGNATITQWQYRKKAGTGGYGHWTAMANSSATTTSHTVTGLTNGTAYVFMVRALNPLGAGAESDEATATPIAPPAKPTGLTASAQNQGVRLSWSDPGDASITQYQYWQKEAAGNAWSWADMAGSGATTTSHTVTGLKNGTAYEFRVRALNPAGKGASSDKVSATPVPPLSKPAKPTGLAASTRDQGVHLSWSDPGDASITQYQYWQKEVSGNFWSWKDMAGSGAATTGHTVTGLKNGAAYEFRVRALNPVGKGAGSDKVSATPMALPSKPTGLTALARDKGAHLSWTDPGNATITKYQYQLRELPWRSGSWTDVAGSGAATTSHTVTGLKNGALYTVRIRAWNLSGMGEHSAKATVTPAVVPLKPSNLKVSLNTTGAGLSWSSLNDPSVTRWQYRKKYGTYGYGHWIDIPGSGAATTSYTVPGLTKSPSYTFMIRAWNNNPGFPSDEAVLVIEDLPKPTGFTAIGKNAEIDLAWSPGVASVAKWQYRIKTGTGHYRSWTDILNSSAATTSYTLQGLTNGVMRRLQIRSVNPVERSAASDEAAAMPNGPPRKLARLLGEAGNTKAHLSWIDSGDASITQWQYRQKAEGGTYGNWAAMSSSTASTTAYTVSNLTNGTTYKFQIRALNPAGVGAASVEAAVRPAAVPSKPTGLMAMGRNDSADLAWAYPRDRTITKYQYRKKTGSGAYGSWTDMAGSSAFTTSFTVSNLKRGATHMIQIRAANAVGESAGSDAATVMPAEVPARPIGLVAVIRDSKATLSWIDPANASITQYQYRQKIGSGIYGSWTDISGSKASTVQHTVPVSSNGAMYAFQIRAVNRAGSGAGSNEAKALAVTSTLEVPSRPLYFAAVPADGAAYLSWQQSRNRTITGWQYQVKEGSGTYGAWANIPDSDRTTTRYWVSALTNGVKYTLRVRAVNASGAGRMSREAVVMPTSGNGTAIIRGIREEQGVGQANIIWHNPNNPSIIGYQYCFGWCGYSLDFHEGWKFIPGSNANTTNYLLTRSEHGDWHRSVSIRALTTLGPGPSSGELLINLKSKDLTHKQPKIIGIDRTNGACRVTLEDPKDLSIIKYELGSYVGTYWVWEGHPLYKGETLGASARNTRSPLVFCVPVGQRIRAVGMFGVSPGSEIATQQMLSAKPTGLTAVGGNAQVELAWTDLDDSGIAKYQFQKKSGDDKYGSWTNMAGSDAATTSYTVMNLQNNTTYKFRIRAVMKSGIHSKTSDEVSAAMLARVPAKPAQLSALAGNAAVRLSWSSSYDASVTQWQYRQKAEGGAYGNWVAMANSMASTTAYTVPDLTNGKTYKFKVRAVNSVGVGTESAEALAMPQTVPARPTGLTATGQSTSAALAWADPGDASITKYQYREKIGAGGYSAWADIADSGASTIGYKVAGLSQNVTHAFQIRALNATGSSLASLEATAVPVILPAKPTGLRAEAGSAKAYLFWSDPGDASITKYQYRQREGAGNYGNWHDVLSSGAATTAWTVPKLSNGATYKFEIRALNQSGMGAASNEASVIPNSVPAKPIELIAGAKSGLSLAALYWRHSGDDTITKWQYQKKASDGNYGNWTDVPNSTALTRVYTILGLSLGTTYAFRIRAMNAVGTGAHSDEAVVRLAPAKPANFVVHSGNGWAHLWWTNPNDPSIVLWQYRQKFGDNGYGNWTDIPSSEASTTSHAVPLWKNGITYTFKIRAINALEGVESDEIAVGQRSFPAMPTNVVALAGNAKVYLSWDALNDASVTRWQYRQKSGSGQYGNWKDIPNSGASTTTYAVMGLSNGKTYTFKVRAVNNAGIGAASSEASTMYASAPSKPTGLTASARDKGVHLSWSNPGNATITQWQYRQKIGAGSYGGWTDIANSGSATTSHIVTGLANGMAHAFKVRALNYSGAGAESDEATAMPVSVPSKPTGLTATTRDRGVNLSWANLGDATVTQWQYRQKVGAGNYGNWKDIANSSATTTSYTVSGLTNRIVHAFKVRAVNSSGSGAESDELMATPAPLPAKPEGLAASARNKGVHLSWTNPSDTTITQWQYRQKIGAGNYGDWTVVAGSSAATASHTVTDLINGTAYAFKVRALNSSGIGEESDEATATPVLAPSEPTGLVASARDKGAHLSWTDPGNATITQWQYRQKAGAGSYGDWMGMAGSSAATTNYVVTGLINGTAYTFRVRAVNSSGTGAESDEATATATAVPSKPTGLVVSARDKGAHLSWTDPGNATITQWQYRQKVGAGSYGDWTDMAGSVAATTSHAVTGLANDTVHAFKVRALNLSGAGAESDEVAVTPVPAPSKPTGLTASARDKGAHLSWTDPGNATITQWQYRQKAGAGSYGDWKDVANSSAATTSHRVTGLANDTVHTFKVRALNSSGTGAESDEATATPVLAPSRPTDLTASARDKGVHLSWTDPGNASVTQWQYRQKAGAGSYGDWTDIAGSVAATTSHTVTGLVNNTAHTFRVRALNSSGTGAESDEATATPVPAPAKPTGLAASARDKGVHLSWTDPGNATITQWQYRQKAGAGGYGDWTDMAGSGAATTSIAVTSLINGTAYTFRVRAVNSSGIGAESDEATATLVPSKPTGLAASARDKGVHLSWTDPGNAAITQWQYRQKAGAGSYGDWTDMAGSGATTTSFAVTNLINGTAYTFRVRAVNSSGAGTESDEATATPVLAPSKPTGLAASGRDKGVHLSWTDPGNATITQWRYRQKAGAGSYGDWTDMAGSGAATTSYTVTGLTNSTAYTFRVRAVNSSGAGAESDEVTATTVPAKPTGLAVLAQHKRVHLSWTDPGNAAITQWQYRQKAGAGSYGNWTDMAGSGATTTNYTVTNLINGRAYTFRVRAVDSSGAGAESDEVTATPKLSLPPKPTGLTASARNKGVHLSWTKPDDSAITKWQYWLETKEGVYGGWRNMDGSGAETTSHEISRLTNGLKFRVKIRALNSLGAGPASDEATATPGPAPAKPTGLAASARDKEVHLSWTDPKNATITQWQYQQKAGAGSYGDWTGMAASSASTTSYAVTNLINGTAYTFRVRAVNSSGTGAESDEATATPLSLPAKPAGLTAAVRNKGMHLSWTDPNDATITQWQYRQKVGAGDYGDWTDITGSAATTTSYTVTGLENGTVHAFTIRAVNALGIGSESDEVSATPKLIPPVKPTGLMASVSNGGVDLTWTNPNDSTITKWQLWLAASGLTGGWGDMAGSNAGTTSYSISLWSAREYRFKVRALNSLGVGESSDELVVQVAPRPTGLAASARNKGVHLSWTGPSDTSVTQWQYRQKRVGSYYYGAWTNIANSSAATTSHTVTGLENGTAYAFQVRTANNWGVGPASAEVMATPTATSMAAMGVGFMQMASVQAMQSMPVAMGGEMVLPTLKLISTDVKLQEEEGSNTTRIRFRVELDRRYGREIQAQLMLEGEAEEGKGKDYTVTGARIVRIKAGADAGAAELLFSVHDDSIYEPGGESITVRAVAESLADAESNTVTHRILDNDAQPGITLAASVDSIRESDGATEVKVKALLDAPINHEIAVPLSLSGTATTAEDYTVAALPKITIAAGELGGSASLSVTPVHDAVAEPDESIVIGGVLGTYVIRPAKLLLTDVPHPVDGEKAAIKSALAELASGVLASARQTLGSRFGRMDVNSVRVAGLPLEFGEDASAESGAWGVPQQSVGSGPEEAFRVSSEEWWRDSAFEYVFQGGGTPRQWSLWGQGDYAAFSDRKDNGDTYEGDLRTAYAGVDIRVDGHWVAGVAAMHGRSRTDYAFGGDEAGGAGLLQTDLTGLHTYASMGLGDSTEIWGTLGTGEGAVRLERRREDSGTADAADIEDGELRMLMGTAGVRSTFGQAEQADAHWALMADAGYVQLETGDGLRTVDGLAVNAYQMRAGVEYSTASDADGKRLESRGQAFVRHDGGDGTEGSGLELIGDMRWADAVSGWEVEAQGRWLTAHSGPGYEERGVSVMVRKNLGWGERGLHLALSPRWGASAESSDAIWGGSAFESGSLGATDEGFAFNAELGYSAWSPRLGQVVHWFGEAGYEQRDSWQARLGRRFTWRRSEAGELDIEVFGKHNAGGEEAGSGVHVQGRLRF